MNENMNQTEFPLAVYMSLRQSPQDMPRPRPAAAAPAYEEIARRAHEIYVERGCPQDPSEEVFRQAEMEKWYKGVAALRAKTREI